MTSSSASFPILLIHPLPLANVLGVKARSLRIGIDIGSTTVKVVVLDEQNKLLFRSYERHYSKARDGPARP